MEADLAYHCTIINLKQFGSIDELKAAANEYIQANTLKVVSAIPISTTQSVFNCREILVSSSGNILSNCIIFHRSKE
jgi:hypothetical protein